MTDSAAVLQRVRDAKHVGWLPRDAPDVGTGEAGTPARGTLTRVQVRADRSSRRIVAAVFKVVGDNAAVASASLVVERLHGATVDDAARLEPLMVVAELELPIERAYAASLAVDAARKAIADWERKR